MAFASIWATIRAVVVIYGHSQSKYRPQLIQGTLRVARNVCHSSPPLSRPSTKAAAGPAKGCNPTRWTLQQQQLLKTDAEPDMHLYMLQSRRTRERTRAKPSPPRETGGRRVGAAPKPIDRCSTRAITTPQNGKMRFGFSSESQWCIIH